MGLPEGAAEICTLAADMIQAENVAQIIDPRSHLENTCSRWYDISRRSVFECFSYIENATFGLVNRLVDAPVNPAYADAYQLPSDYLGLDFIIDPEVPLTQMSFTFRGKRHLYINNNGEDTLYIGYKYDNISPRSWSSSIIKLVACEIAVNVVTSLTGGKQKFRVLNESKQSYQAEARKNALSSKPMTTYMSSNLLGARNLYSSGRRSQAGRQSVRVL